MTNHTHMSELNDGKGADVETGIMPLVKFLNKMGVETCSSSEGCDTPKVECPAFVTMRGDYKVLVDVLFRQIQPMVVGMEGVFIQVMWLDMGYVGVLHIPRKYLEDVTKRVGCWLEMLHK
jgi:hypothetical protein